MEIKQNIILGAGPAGMAAAMELNKHKIKFILIEKENQVGGLSKTYEFGNFRTDNGPHRFFSKNKFLYEFIGDLLGKEWISVKRSTRQYIDGKYYDYPVNAIQAFKNVGLLRVFRILFDYLIAVVQYRIFKKEIKNFEDYIVANFGRSLGNLNMLNYSEKMWGMKCSRLDADWAKQRIKGLNFREAIVNAVNNSLSIKGKNSPKTLVDEFYYPIFGTGRIYEKIFEKIRLKNKIILNDSPVEINHKGGKIVKIKLKEGKNISVNNLISSMHIDDFISILNPKAPQEALNAVKKLKYRSQVYIFLTVNKKSISNDQWIYFPNKEIPLFRISEMKNFSEKMSPKNNTSLFVEYFCWKDDGFWNMKKQDLFEMTVNWLERLKLLNRKQVLSYHYLRKEKTYPVYDVGYKRNLKIVKKYMDSFSNLTYIGRPGRFKYTNQDHSLEMGFLAAQGIIENRRVDVENVGSEKEYFEKMRTA